MKRLVFAAALALSWHSPLGFAADPVSEFTATARSSFDTCRSCYWNTAGEQKECAAKQQAVVQPKFAAAQKALTKNKAELSRLRDFYALWRVSIEEPMVRDGPRLECEKRMSDAAATLSERATRIELDSR